MSATEPEAAKTVAYPASFYAARAGIPSPRPPLRGKVRADVAIVGGGFTGIAAALHLAECGRHAIVVEAARIGFEASGRNGGQIHSGFNVEQGELEQEFGKPRAHGLWTVAERAKALVRAHIRDRSIACSLHGGILVAAHDRAAADDLAAKVRHLNAQYDYDAARFLSSEETAARIGSRIYHGALEDRGGGHLDPLALVLGLAQAAEEAGAVIYEGTRALAVEPRNGGVAATCTNGEIRAQTAILACDAFMPAIAPALAPYLANIESYVVATAPVNEAAILPRNDAVADTRRALDYYRMSDERQLVFAGGETTLAKARDIDALVRPRLERVFPQLRQIAITHRWSGTVGITRRRLPHFGRLAPNILFGYGYSGQGVALGTYGGKILADAVMGHDEEFALLASIPPKPFPFSRGLRQPMAAAMVLGLKLSDAL